AATAGGGAAECGGKPPPPSREAARAAGARKLSQRPGQAGGPLARLLPLAVLAYGLAEAGPQGFGAIFGDSLRRHRRLSPKLHLQRQLLRVAEDLERHGLPGLLRADEVAGLLDRRGGTSVGPDDDVATRAPPLPRPN